MKLNLHQGRWWLHIIERCSCVFVCVCVVVNYFQTKLLFSNLSAGKISNLLRHTFLPACGIGPRMFFSFNNAYFGLVKRRALSDGVSDRSGRATPYTMFFGSVVHAAVTSLWLPRANPLLHTVGGFPRRASRED